MIRLVAVEECKKGDIVAEDILNGHGTVLLAKSTALNGYTLDKLNELGIRQVKIQDTLHSSVCQDEGSRYRQAKI